MTNFRFTLASAIVAAAIAAEMVVAAQTGTAKPAGTAAQSKPAAAPAAAGPVFVVETQNGTFEFETYPQDAPKTVERIVTLVKQRFYNGQVFHRVEPGFVVQWGDPQTKDMRNLGAPGWGNHGTGKPIGVSEITPRRTHKVGAVAMAHSGDPKLADSQMYIVLGAERTKALDGKYTVFGQVTSGMDVVRKIKKNDLVKRMTIKTGTAPAK